ncbi:MAG: hypothetical protein IJC70_05215 [Firmicutes bacterium]|nr:hypothetical protein [Bacillota bacterium]
MKMCCEFEFCDYNAGGICQRDGISLDRDARCRDFCCGGISRGDDEPRLSGLPHPLTEEDVERCR